MYNFSSLCVLAHLFPFWDILTNSLQFSKGIYLWNIFLLHSKGSVCLCALQNYMNSYFLHGCHILSQQISSRLICESKGWISVKIIVAGVELQKNRLFFERISNCSDMMTITFFSICKSARASIKTHWPVDVPLHFNQEMHQHCTLSAIIVIIIIFYYKYYTLYVASGWYCMRCTIPYRNSAILKENRGSYCWKHIMLIL